MIASPAMSMAQSANTTGQVSIQPAPSAAVKLFSAPLRKGDQNAEVKELQRILKSDPVVYPQGLVTGTFGPLTEEAVKRLQKKYGLAETGVLDAATQEIILPAPTKIELKIVSPNGGESWDRSQKQIIKWKAAFPAAVVEGREAIPSTAAEPEKQMEKPLAAPFFHWAVLDLLRDSDPSFRERIATVNLFAAEHVWLIPNSVPSGSDYRVRISVGWNTPCPYPWETFEKPTTDSTAVRRTYPCPLASSALAERFLASDTSDGPFKIFGETLPPPNPEFHEIIKKMEMQVGEMEAVLKQLSRQLEAIRELIALLKKTDGQ